MLNKEQIAQLLYSKLDYIYCHNCHFRENKYDICENCHRKNMNWEISKEYCQELAELICKDN